MSDTAHKGLTEAKITELKTANAGRELHVLELDIGEELHQVVVRPPGIEYDEWREARDREGATTVSKRLADQNFVNACRVYPSGEEWIALCSSKRGIAGTFAGELAELAGVSRAARRKKL